MSSPTSKPVPQTGAELLVKSLEAQGVQSQLHYIQASDELHQAMGITPE